MDGTYVGWHYITFTLNRCLVLFLLNMHDDVLSYRTEHNFFHLPMMTYLSGSSSPSMMPMTLLLSTSFKSLFTTSFTFQPLYFVKKGPYNDKKEKKIFLITKEIKMGLVAKSYTCMRKGFLIFEEMRKYLVLYKEAVSHI
jgi:hypothetical protein